MNSFAKWAQKQKKLKQEAKKKSAEALEYIPAGRLAPQRRCHNCGTPTDDYRCAKCWSKVRKSILPEVE